MSEKPEAFNGLLDDTEKLLRQIKTPIRLARGEEHETAWLEQAEACLINAYLSMEVASRSVKGGGISPPEFKCHYCEFKAPSLKKVQYHETHMCWKNPDGEV